MVTGPIYEGAIDTIGTNKVDVPSHLYKVIFDPVRVDAIAFILPNKKLTGKKLPEFIRNIDDVEEKSGLDFLSLIDDEIEGVVEAEKQSELW